MKSIVRLNLTFLAILFLASGCSNEKDEISNLQEEVMAIHDEVMPKMQDLMKLKKELEGIKSETDSTKEMDTYIEIQELQSEITAADKSMMQWMRNYDSKLENKTEAEKIEYLGKEKIKIQQVKQQMLSVISRSKTFIENNKD